MRTSLNFFTGVALVLLSTACQVSTPQEQKPKGVITYKYDLFEEEELQKRAEKNVEIAKEKGYDKDAQAMIGLINPYLIIYKLAFENTYLLQSTDEIWKKSIGISGTHLERSFYTDLSRKKLTTVEGNGSKKTQELISLKWKIYEETKKLGNFTCQKATTQSEGKTVTAWFTEEIPISGGPAGYSGLPGFILELYTPGGYAYTFEKYSPELPEGISLTPP